MFRLACIIIIIDQYTFVALALLGTPVGEFEGPDDKPYVITKYTPDEPTPVDNTNGNVYEKVVSPVCVGAMFMLLRIANDYYD